MWSCLGKMFNLSTNFASQLIVQLWLDLLMCLLCKQQQFQFQNEIPSFSTKLSVWFSLRLPRYFYQARFTTFIWLTWPVSALSLFYIHRDWDKFSSEGEPNKLFIAFSLYTNGRQLFDITKSKSSNAIHCLHGIRALSVLWIIFGHRFDERFMVPAVNSEEVSRFTEKPISLIHTTFTLAVDTFLLMGGLLATLSFLSALDW